MTNLGKLSALIFISILYGNTNADVDCNKKPQFGPIQACCKSPKPNFSAYAAQCDKYNGNLKSKGPSPCFMECVFNVTKSIDGNKLNLPNVRTMSSSMFASNPEFIEPIVEGLEKCSTVISENLDNMKSRDGIMKMKIFKMGKNLPAECSKMPIAALYAICAIKNLVVNCPTTAWTATSQCKQAKEYLSACGFKKMGRQRGGDN